MVGKICYQFARDGTCKFKSCKFEHIRQGDSPKAANGPGRRGGSEPDEFNELSAWKRQIAYGRTSQPLGSRLGEFFKKARKLIQGHESSLQEVIQCLSKEGGLRRIQELIERDFSVLSPTAKRTIFAEEMLPFIEVITYPSLLTSLVLEQAVGSIYNCIFGINARRAAPLLQFLADTIQLEVEADGEASCIYLESSLSAFWHIVDLNSTAFIQESLQQVVQRFADLLNALHGLDGGSGLHQSVHYLERLQRRLNIGLSLPTLLGSSRKVPSNAPPVAFVAQKDPPGKRHDNDHADIGKVKIMPTFQEILSSRTEYLPVKDPRQWHLPGLAGLLDRNFRLLREDTVGQLRDAIHAELRPRATIHGRRGQTRMHIYRDVLVKQVDLHKRSGLQFLVQFSQPTQVRGMSKQKQQDWWQLSKRLQASAFVCLLDRRGTAVFCTVAPPDLPSKRPGAVEKKDPRMANSLSGDINVASVVLELVEPGEHTWQYILDCHGAKGNLSAMSLVEFPGILLPSFQPTLLALQKMQKAADIPMSDFIAPSDTSSLSEFIDVPPPLYSVVPGFSFDLKCLMNDGSSLTVEHSKPIDIKTLQSKSTLDDAQATALVRSLQRRIALIQGPPGTGKSFTGVALIKVLLANKKKVKKGLGPILCVCYTNHALDQLLEDLLDNDITTQIIRIGSQSKSERLQPLNLRTVAREVDKTRMEKHNQWLLRTSLDEDEESFQELKLNSAGPAHRLKEYIKRSNPLHYQQLFQKDADGFQRQSKSGPLGILHSWLNGGQRHGHTRPIPELAMVHVDMMTVSERRLLHAHWSSGARMEALSEARSLLSSHSGTKHSLDRVQDEIDLRCLRTADVIGVTTTGLARNLNMLRRLPSKVLLCEEAGEVLEAHLLTSLLPSLEHVILIGDHQQLRPQIQNYELSRESSSGKAYSLDRSLFERLVEPDDGVGVQLPFCSLETQRRMHPSMSRLVRDTLYPRLQDSPVVSEYPEVMGMRHRLFWLDHRHAEGDSSGDDAIATSHWNDHEIDLTIALVNHLIRQGTYASGDIAVLTPYLGQLHRIRRRLAGSYTITLGERDQEDLDNAGFAAETTDSDSKVITKSSLLQTLRVATIDNFQGEEAKVVVISLVRSNKQNQCGFLRTPNRINVLLSRAMHGMYVIGNSETSKGVDMWNKVINILESEGNIGSSLDLCCPRHPETPITVSEPDDFLQLAPEGGCSLQCGKRLRCGHPCKQKCHSDMLHAAVYCTEPCQRPQKGCTHPCPRPCGDPCPKKCQIPVFDAGRILPCGHSMASLPCWQSQDLSTVKCPTLVKKEVPHCKHSITIACHVDVASVEYQCRRPCQTILPCGHSCKRRCADCLQRTAEGVATDHGQCTQPCGRPYSTCAHSCSAPCHDGTPCGECTAPCDVQCGHSRCPQKCSDPCPPCAVSECLSSCPHSTCSMPCAAPCNHVPCSRRCEKPLSCGHQCPSVCGESCPPATFCQVCAAESIKSTPVDFILGDVYEEIDLDVNPCIFPQCGHFLTIESMDGQMDFRSHYNMNDEGRPVSIASSLKPFSIDDIRTCATCRGSLRNLSRYGRLVRRALLDEATKKFIVYLNQSYIPMAQALPKALSELRDGEGTRKTADIAKRIFHGGSKVRIEGPPSHQVRLMATHINKHDKPRWKLLLDLRDRISTYRNRVKLEEQPYNQVRNMVEGAHRRNQALGQFEFDEDVLQTKGHLQATSLLLRLDTALLADFLSLKKQAPSSSESILHVNLAENKKQSKTLIDEAASSVRVLQQVEGHIFLAQLCALERQSVTDAAKAERLLQEGTSAIDQAQGLCDLHTQQTRGLSDEIEGTRNMLHGSTFYTPVTSEERAAVLAAMAREFRGTGHWYYCENGHPFTIGECGGAMQLSTCPECGARVGGQHHRTADGVTRASDLEDGLRGMHI
ncbi:hypothetical protein ASPVEDRAFT_163989 [Aspergillus versicolor CBS 583.65]|uniref:Uncharacterized protein n=1 Tax=Aspergillus versicolor CBS 583.65 TaxID=1036611 RepID=A0A1L9PE96_ASPVE|nr:uncharacterized protein ASPVEDRAFT_163989 [Aspergillus versicolor CBS 583.65]OJI99811.1 hypothetical protein ASPVEDRAFT_163989 [Aspergillus versicolor CBS 583.65]